MTGTLTQSIATYDAASHAEVNQSPRRFNESRSAYLIRPILPLNYAGLWPILAAQNASVELIFTTNDLFELQGVSGAVTGGWGLSNRVNQAFGVLARSAVVQARKPDSVRRISLVEARRIAVTALLEAEERRREERRRESAFWAALEDEL